MMERTQGKKHSELCEDSSVRHELSLGRMVVTDIKRDKRYNEIWTSGEQWCQACDCQREKGGVRRSLSTEHESLGKHCPLSQRKGLFFLHPSDGIQGNCNVPVRL